MFWIYEWDWIIFCWYKIDGEIVKGCLRANSELSHTQTSPQHHEPQEMVHNQPPWAHAMYLPFHVDVAHDFYRNSWLGKLLYPIYNKIFNMERAFHRDIILQQGLVLMK